MADTKLTALTEVSVPTTDDLIYWVDDPAGTPASYKASATRVGGLLSRGIVQGRLTTETGVPVSTSDRTAQGTIYFTPYNGNLLTVYDGTRWKLYTFSELSLALTATSGKNYDVFVYDNSGTLTLELSAAWTNDTTRADALALQDGIYVKSGTTTRRWLGTIRASGANVTADSGGGSTTQVGGQRFVWNAYNRVPRTLCVIDTTDNWTYNTGTWRYADNASGNKVEWVTGDAATLVAIGLLASTFIYSQSGRINAVAVGVDWTSGLPTTGLRQASYSKALVTASQYVAVSADYVGLPGLGYHYGGWLEYGGDGTTIWVGDNAGDGQQTGLNGWIQG